MKHYVKDRATIVKHDGKIANAISVEQALDWRANHYTDWDERNALIGPMTKRAAEIWIAQPCSLFEAQLLAKLPLHCNDCGKRIAPASNSGLCFKCMTNWTKRNFPDA